MRKLEESIYSADLQFNLITITYTVFLAYGLGFVISKVDLSRQNIKGKVSLPWPYGWQN